MDCHIYVGNIRHEDVVLSFGNFLDAEGCVLGLRHENQNYEEGLGHVFGA